MREIKDRAQIDAWVEAEHIRDTFDTRDLSFGARRFAKGEIIASPDAPLREPYAVWMQGGLTYPSGKIGVKLAAQSMYTQGLLGSGTQNK